jgi:hypothetical protein
MNKKLLLAIIFMISGIILANAQCTIDSICNKLVCPDTITNLPNANVTVLYNTSLTVKVPVDTTVSGFLVTIDSINYTSVTGLPSGFTLTPNKSGWDGGTYGCIQILGTPADSMQGKAYKLIITITAHGKYTTIPVSSPEVITGYKFFVNDTTLGINEINAHNNVSFTYNSEDIKIHSSNIVNNASIIVNDITGRELMHLNNMNGNDFIINKGNLSNGIYIISLMNNQKLIARGKVVVE